MTEESFLSFLIYFSLLHDLFSMCIVGAQMSLVAVEAVKSTDWCGVKTCNSKDYSYRECDVLGDDFNIVNVTVTYKISRANCTYFNGPNTDYDGTDGVYGFQRDKIWVHKGCQAIFHYCYTDEIFTTSSTAEASKGPTVHETRPVTTARYGNGLGVTIPHTQGEWIEDIPNAVVIAAFAILLIIVIALIVVGFKLWKKRYGRSKTIFKHARPAIGGNRTTWKNKNINAFITNRTQKKPTILTVSKSAKREDTDAKTKEERYVNYLNMSQPLRLPTPVTGLAKKENPMSAETKAANKPRRPPVPTKPPPKLPKPRDVYQNTVLGSEPDEYLVPVTKGGGIKSTPAGIEKATRAVENEYQGIGQDHIYASID